MSEYQEPGTAQQTFHPKILKKQSGIRVCLFLFFLPPRRAASFFHILFSHVNILKIVIL